MIHILTFTTSVLFIIAFAFRNKWQFQEKKLSNSNDLTDQSSQANKKWHAWQGAVQLCFFSLIGLNFGPIEGIFAALTYMALFWILFDGLLNKIALDKPFFYVGTTAFIDKQFQKLKKPQLFMAITKIALLIAFTTIYITTSI